MNRVKIAIILFYDFVKVLIFMNRLQPLDTIQSNKSSQENTKYIPTQLGLGCLASSLSPDEALTVFTELQKARKCFVLENELHIIYQVMTHS